MKFLHILWSIILMTLILSACSTNKFDPLPEDQNLIITVNIKDMTLTFVDANQYKKVAQWALDKPYSGGLMLPDNDSLLLFGKGNNTVDIFSLSKGEMIGHWKVGKGIVNAKLLSNKKEIVFADQEKNQARFFTIKGQEIGQVSTEQMPYTILEGKKKLYIINTNDEVLTLIDKKEKVELDSIKIHPYATGALLKENANELWIGGHGAGTEIESNIHVYNDSGKLLRTIHAPLMPINFAQWNDFTFVISHGSNTLYQLTDEGEILQSMRIGANPFELRLFQNQLIVAGYDSNDIYFINPLNLQIRQKVNVGKGPFQMIVRESSEYGEN